MRYNESNLELIFNDNNLKEVKFITDKSYEEVDSITAYLLKKKGKLELINHIQDFINSGESKNIFDDGHSEEEATILYVSYVIKDGEPSQIRVITELENLIYALHDDCILYSVVIEDNLL